jgi:hypothetical protein
MNSSNNLQLIFPEFEYKLTKKEGKLFIYDPIAKKYRALSPEEWVRQHCLNFLTKHLGYPATNIQIERAFKVNKLVRRTDIQVFNSLGELLIIIECKAPHIEINEITFQQISQYQQKNVAKYLALTNGLENHIFEINTTENLTNKINQFPAYL